VISKKTFREFDTEYNEWSDWPLELVHRVYCEIIDEFNKHLEEKNEEVVSTDSTPADVDGDKLR
jgi:hypothetical protein